MRDRRLHTVLMVLAGFAILVAATVFLGRSPKVPPGDPAKAAPPVAVQPPARIETPEERVRRMETAERARKMARVRREEYPAEKLEELVVGASEEEVLKLLGEPIRKQRGRDADSACWVYTGLTTNSDLTFLQFYRDGGRVIVESVVYQLETYPDLRPLRPLRPLK